MNSYVPESRTSAFQGGMTGTGLNTATSIQQHIPAMFQPGSLLQLPNMLQTPNAQSMSTYERAKPFDSSMRSLAMATGGNTGTVNA